MALFTSEQTWKQVANFANGSNLANAGVNEPSSFIDALPTLFAGNSGEWIIDCHEFYESVSSNLRSDFGATATAILRIKEVDVIDTPVILGTVAVGTDGSNPEFNRLTANWDQDEITDYYAGKRVMMYIEVLGSTDDERTVYQELSIENENGDALLIQETKNIPVSTQTISVDTALVAYPGKLVVFIDASANTVEVTLASAAAYAQQELVLVPTDNTLDITVVGTVNGDAGGFSSLVGELNGAHLFADGVAWFNLNHTTVVT